MWNVGEWKSASYSMFSWRSSLLEEIDKALEAYDEIKASRPSDLTLRIYTLDLIIAAIDRWYEKEGKLSNHSRAGIKLYNAAKLEKNLLKSRRIADQKAAEEQKELIASIQGTLSQMMKAPPVTPRIPAPPPMPLTSAQKQEITDSMTQARKQLLATKLGQHLLSELTTRRLKLLGVGDVSAELEAADRQLIVDDLPPLQLGYLTAKNLLNLDTGLGNRKDTVKGEAIRILAYMIGNSKDVADAFLNKNFEVVVVPRQKYMTDLAEFSSLGTANTFDGRGWKGTRGAGYVFDTPDGCAPADLAAYMQSKKKVYVAVTEENITGDKFYDVDRNMDRSYDCKYSTTLHEFAHTIDKFALNSSQRSTLDRLYKRKRSDGAGNELKIGSRARPSSRSSMRRPSRRTRSPPPPSSTTRPRSTSSGSLRTTRRKSFAARSASARRWPNRSTRSPSRCCRMWASTRRASSPRGWGSPRRLRPTSGCRWRSGH